MKLILFGNKNFARRWTLISLRKDMGTTLGICSEKKVKSRTTNHGPVIKSSIRSPLVLRSFMDVHLRLSLRII
jgi:hypothetical protein